jgi:hypothetical protein
MRIPVLLGILAASLALAILNNLFNSHGVPWFGSPEVLPKPEGWPSLSAGQGILAGLKVAMRGFEAHKMAVLMTVLGVPAAIALLHRLIGASPSAVLRSALRIGLAAMFFAAAKEKFLDPEDFSLLVAQYQFLPSFLVYPFSLWMSSIELVVAFGLLLLPWETELSAWTALLMAMFIVALGQALARGLGIACGCFDIAGAADAGETWFSLLRDLVLLPPLLWMTISGRRRWLWQLRDPA